MRFQQEQVDRRESTEPTSLSFQSKIALGAFATFKNWSIDLRTVNRLLEGV